MVNNYTPLEAKFGEIRLGTISVVEILEGTVADLDDSIADGSIASDPTLGKLYFKKSGEWKEVTVAS